MPSVGTRKGDRNGRGRHPNRLSMALLSFDHSGCRSSPSCVLNCTSIGNSMSATSARKHLDPLLVALGLAAFLGEGIAVDRGMRPQHDNDGSLADLRLDDGLVVGGTPSGCRWTRIRSARGRERHHPADEETRGVIGPEREKTSARTHAPYTLATPCDAPATPSLVCSSAPL